MTEVPVLEALGVRELQIMSAFLHNEPTCPRHPSYSDCGCDRPGRLPAGWADRQEERCIERDDRETGLTLVQREALLGWLMAQYVTEAGEPIASLLPGFHDVDDEEDA